MEEWSYEDRNYARLYQDDETEREEDYYDSERMD